MSWIKRRAALVGFALLDAATRTWPAFWCTIALIIFYCWWNVSSTIRDHFDPYPYTFLMVLIAGLSYLQNIIIMTLQREQDDKFGEIKAKQDEQDQRMLHLMETATAQGQLLISMSHADAARDEQMLEMFHALPCRSEAL